MSAAPRRHASAVVATAVLAALTGCGHTSAADRVRHYIDASNAVQSGAAPQMQAANATYARFAQGKLGSTAAITRLEAAEQVIHVTRSKLAALPAPPLALRLRRRLLAVFDADAGLAREATEMARYLPEAARTRGVISAAGLRLQSDLRAATTPAAQARALQRYARGLGRADSALRRLTPPPVLAAAHQGQLLRLEAAIRVARRLRAALAAGDARAVAALLQRFRAESRSSAGQGAISRAASRAYVRRYRRLNTLVGAMQREEARLQRTLG